MAQVQSSYDPLNPTPYQPVPTPEQPPAPTPNIPSPSPFGGQPGFQFEGRGNISHAGAAAGVVDNILRGYVNGKAQGEAVQALRQKKKFDNLNASYTADAERLWTLSQKQISEKGAIDPNSDEYKQALSAVQGSWTALQDARKGLLDQSGGGGKKKKQQAERSPAEVFADPKATPQEKYAAMIGMSEKLGPPIIGQIQNYVAQAQSQRNRPEAKDTDLRANAQLELDQLRSKKEPLTEAENARVKQLLEFLTPTPKLGAGKEGLTRYEKGKDGWEEYQVDTAGDEIPGTRRPLSTAAAQGPKVGSFGDFMKAGYGNDPTPEDYVKGRALWAQSGAGTTVGEHVVMVPQKDGSIIPVTVQTTSSKSFPAADSAASTRTDQHPPAGSLPSSSVALPAATGAPQSATQAPAGGAGAASSPSVAPQPPAPASGVAPARRSKPGAGVVSQGGPIGGRLTPVQAKADEDVVAATKLNSLAAQAIQSSNPGQQRQLALALIKGMAGRMNMQEYAIYTKGYGVENTVDGLIRGIENGTLPPGVVRQLARDAYADLKAAKDAQAVAYGKTSNLPDRPSNVPAGFVYFTASDGTGHWIDPKNLDAAKKIDPKLQVIQ